MDDPASIHASVLFPDICVHGPNLFTHEIVKFVYNKSSCIERAWVYYLHIWIFDYLPYIHIKLEHN